MYLTQVPGHNIKDRFPEAQSSWIDGTMAHFLTNRFPCAGTEQRSVDGVKAMGQSTYAAVKATHVDTYGRAHGTPTAAV